MAWFFVSFYGGAPTGILFRSESWALNTLEEVHVLEKVSAGHKRVTLLDLVDHATIPEDWRKTMAGVDIGEAPSGGAQKYIDPKNLKPFLCRFIDSQGTASSRVQIHMPEKIVVERKSTELSQEQIEAIYRKFVMENAPWNPQDIVIQRITISGLPVIPAGEVNHEVVPSPREKFLGNVTVAVNFYVDGEKARSLKVAGKVDVYQNVVQLNRPLRQNETITEADIEIQRINIAETPDRYVTQPEQVINKRLVRSVGARQPLEPRHLDRPLVLKKGDPVTIVYDQPGLKVTAKGQAQENGSSGSTIRVHNVASNKTVLCRVLDGETVQAVQ